MKINKLRLYNYRNITAMELVPGNGANIIYGDNAQGKTNILEAIWLFSGAKSFRGAKDTDLLRFGQKNCSINMDFTAGGRGQTAAITVEGSVKTASLNGIKLAGAAKLAGQFCAVLFSPDHLLLVKHGPEYRRKLMDESLSQAYPKYGAVLDSYQRILKQRARLLKDVTMNTSLFDLLDVWDKSLIDYAAYITVIRAAYINRLTEHAREIYSGISGGKEKLEIKYRFSGGPTQASSRQEMREYLEQAVKKARREDIAQGRTTIGPHRDDLDITIGNAAARSFSSQGQQRSCVLALKLAECALLEERSGEAPTVLLDDVMSELDESRRAYLLNKLHNKQVVITCCDVSMFSGMADGEVYNVKNGSLIEN